jgi:CRP-like cAMP-binding protein
MKHPHLFPAPRSELGPANFSTLQFFSLLDPADVELLVQDCESKTVLAGQVLVTEGSKLDSLFFVARGLFDVIATRFENRRIRHLGAGSLIGEVSWLDRTTASATIRAVESGEVLAMPFDRIDARFMADPEFSSRFYRAIARTIAESLRSIELSSREDAYDFGNPTIQSEVTRKTVAAVSLLKKLLIDIDKALRSDSESSDALAEQAIAQMDEVCVEANTSLAALPDQHVSEAFGLWLQRELLPFVLLARTAERSYSKPRGYAGEYYTIRLIHGNQPYGTGRIGAAVDRWFLSTPPFNAVRNRRGLCQH